MAYLIAGIAFLVGIAALYLATEAMKKVDRTLADFLTTHLNIIGDRLRELETGLHTARSQIVVEQRETERIKQAFETVDVALRQLNDDVNRVRVDVQMIERKSDPDPRRRMSVTG